MYQRTLRPQKATYKSDVSTGNLASVILEKWVRAPTEGPNRRSGLPETLTVLEIWVWSGGGHLGLSRCPLFPSFWSSTHLSCAPLSLSEQCLTPAQAKMLTQLCYRTEF